MSKGHELKHFYRVLFSDRIACIVLGALGTLGGRFEYWQREYAFGWGDGQWNRKNICHDWREALQLLRRDGCNAINLGGIFSHVRVNVATKALTPYDLAAAPGFAEGPRDWERRVIREHRGTPAGGEMVIDVDLDDRTDKLYNRKGICACAGHNRTVCEVCWHVFMDPAQVVIEYLLKHFHIHRYLAYFSGRRGVHFMLLEPWIIRLTNDERARLMDTLATPPTEHSDLGRAVFALLAPFAVANPILNARCRPTGLNDPLSYEVVMRELYPKMDIPVAADGTHLHGVPLTLHPDTRILRVPIQSASDPSTRFSYKHHRYDVDRLTRLKADIMWAGALRLLAAVLGPDSPMKPEEWLQQALAQGGHATTKSEALNSK